MLTHTLLQHVYLYVLVFSKFLSQVLLMGDFVIKIYSCCTYNITYYAYCVTNFTDFKIEKVFVYFVLIIIDTRTIELFNNLLERAYILGDTSCKPFSVLHRKYILYHRSNTPSMCWCNVTIVDMPHCCDNHGVIMRFKFDPCSMAATFVGDLNSIYLRKCECVKPIHVCDKYCV